MVNSVLSTVDTEYFRRAGSNNSKFTERAVAFVAELDVALSERGIKVETYVPRVPRSRRSSASIWSALGERERLEEAISNNDVILHFPGLVKKADQVRIPGIRITYVADMINKMIRQVHIDKAHIFGRENKLRIGRTLSASGIPTPYTVEAANYLIFGGSLPVVLKHKMGTCSKQIYFVDDMSTLDDFFYHPTFHADGRLTLSPLAPEKPKDYIVQEFVACPSDYYTNFRVFTVADRILGAVLNVSGKPKSIRRTKNGFLRIQSNFSRGGFQIPIYPYDQSIESPLERSILASHGIDPDHPALPSDLEQYAKIAGRELTKRGFIISGQDYILKADDGRYLFLEANPFPGLNMFNTLFFDRKGTGEESTKFAIRLVADALTMYEPQKTEAAVA